MANGLLGKIGSGLEGLLNNPLVQGLAGSAAFGASPLLGLLAGGQINAGRKQRSLENDILREQLSGIRRQQGAADQLQSLLSGSVPTDRLLDVEGGPASIIPSATPGGSVPTAATAGGQRQITGLLPQLAPAATAQGLLGNIFPTQRAAPAVVRVADEVFGVAPSTEKTAWIKENFNPNASAEAQRATIEMLRAQVELENSTDERDRTRREEDVEIATFNNSLNTVIDQLFELADVNEQLAGTGQRPGFGAGARSSLGSAGAFAADVVGLDELSGELQGNVNLAERFDTLANEILIESLNTGDFDARTDTKFRQFSSTKPTRDGMGSRANSLAIADKFDAALLSADANNVAIPPELRQRVEARSKALREFQLAPATILQMPVEGLLDLDPDEVDRFSEEQQQALAIRLNQLRQQ